MTDFINLFVNGRMEITDFRSRTGVNENETITLADLSVAVLHDLLAQRLISE
jgi:hypothetical protein